MQKDMLQVHILHQLDIPPLWTVECTRDSVDRALYSGISQVNHYNSSILNFSKEKRCTCLQRAQCKQ